MLFGGLNAGSDTATDIQTGFFDRLLASPVARTSILVGRLMGAAVTGAGQAVVFIVVYGDLRRAGGRRRCPAMLVLVAYAMVLALVIGGFAAMMALRTGSAEAVQNVFPLTFILLFISSAFFPTEAMSGVYQTLAEANPITWMIDGMRYQVVVGLRPRRGRGVDRRRRGARRAGDLRRPPGAARPLGGVDMTAVARRPTARRSRSWVPVALALARRSLVTILRIPAAVVPLIVMPMFFVIAFSGSFSSLADLPSFPTDNVLNWFVPFAILQGAAFAGFGTGFSTVRDIETGFYDRLLLAPGHAAGPVRRARRWPSLVAGHLHHVVVLVLGILLGAELLDGLARPARAVGRGPRRSR